MVSSSPPAETPYHEGGTGYVPPMFTAGVQGRDIGSLIQPDELKWPHGIQQHPGLPAGCSVMRRHPCRERHEQEEDDMG